jgi:hypothetical protein
VAVDAAGRAVSGPVDGFGQAGRPRPAVGEESHSQAGLVFVAWAAIIPTMRPRAFCVSAAAPKPWPEGHQAMAQPTSRPEHRARTSRSGIVLALCCVTIGRAAAQPPEFDPALRERIDAFGPGSRLRDAPGLRARPGVDAVGGAGVVVPDGGPACAVVAGSPALARPACRRPVKPR